MSGKIIRYQVVYGKSGYPMSKWVKTETAARDTAAAYRLEGYSVDVWMHTLTDARKTAI